MDFVSMTHFLAARSHPSASFSSATASGHRPVVARTMCCNDAALLKLQQRKYHTKKPRKLVGWVKADTTFLETVRNNLHIDADYILIAGVLATDERTAWHASRWEFFSDSWARRSSAALAFAVFAKGFG